MAGNALGKALAIPTLHSPSLCSSDPRLGRAAHSRLAARHPGCPGCPEDGPRLPYGSAALPLSCSAAFFFFHSSASGLAGLPLVDEVSGKRFLSGGSDNQANPQKLGDPVDTQVEDQRHLPEEPVPVVLAEPTLHLVSGACSLPHPEKVERGGEDAHFIVEEALALGVADGVGGWADVGVDAGLYARELMGHTAEAARDEPRGMADPLRMLRRAHKATHSQGSATACILVLSQDKLVAANVGDSGFVVIREGRTVFRSPVQQHDFNFPYQLGSEGSDMPESAELFSLPVAAGDILVVGTDGLFDNVYEAELTAVVVHSARAGWGPKDTAARIAALARVRALDRTRQTPFAKAAQEAGFRYTGGKIDDITVVVSYIQNRTSQSDN